MPDAREIAADPSWIPHRIDVSARTVEFIHVPRSEISAQGFLADRDPPSAGRALLGWEQVAAMQPEPGSLHFIFHTAFCRSTLLVRALDEPGVVKGLNEPGIIASMVNAGDAAKPLIAPLLALLARPHSPGEVVVVKPTNHANVLMPALIHCRPESRAVLMTNDLPVFLSSIVRRGMMGRRWGRQLFLEMQSYAGMDFGMDGRETFLMTDVQAAGLAWFLAQRWFNLFLSGQVPGLDGERFRLLDGDAFNANRAETIDALMQFAGVDPPNDLVEKLAAGSVFAKHAKLGSTFDAAIQTGQPEAPDEEITQVQKWVGMIADQAHLSVPLRQTLF